MDTMSMNRFKTRTGANEGHKLKLYTPDGLKTEEWIQIYSVDSDAFYLEETRQKRQLPLVEIEAREIQETKEREKFFSEKQKQAELELIASLVKAWSFKEKCTRETVTEFLREAPQIASQIDRAASQRRLFMRAVSKN